MYVFVYQLIIVYVIDDFVGFEGVVCGQEFLNWFELYKVFFNIGIVFGVVEQFFQVCVKFEEFLDFVIGLEVCGVWINFVFVVEWMGDVVCVDGDGVMVVQLYGEVLIIIVEIFEECCSDEVQQQFFDLQCDMFDIFDGNEDCLKQKQQEQEQQQLEEQFILLEQEQFFEDKLCDLQDKFEQGMQECDQQWGDEFGGMGMDKLW